MLTLICSYKTVHNFEDISSFWVKFFISLNKSEVLEVCPSYIFVSNFYQLIITFTRVNMNWSSSREPFDVGRGSVYQQLHLINVHNVSFLQTTIKAQLATDKFHVFLNLVKSESKTPNIYGITFKQKIS